MSALRVLRLLPLFFFAACSTNQPVLPKASTALRGLVRGGQQPISGSTIQLYAVGTTGDGSSATPLLSPAPKSDSSGNFNITGIYTCPSATTLVYIVATGGNPGLASGTNNSAISLMAALGPCGNLSAATYININELTTAASVNALASFAASPSAIGSSAADAASLTSAFSLANEFANWSTGSSPGLGVPAGTSIPIARINTLANILATCINSPGGTAGDLTSCGNLFSLTTPSGMSPATDTVTAALHLAVSPALNTSALFNLFAATAPFQPSLTVAPSDFSLGLMVSSGLQPSPSAVSFGSANVGSTSNVQSITLSNTSQSPIALSGISISGINAAEFTQTNNCPVSLAVGALCTVQATFTPSTAGAHIALLSVANNSANSPLLIGLSGVGTAPIVGVPHLLSTSPASVTAGSPSITVTLSGTGFTSSSTIYVYSSAQPTRFLSAQSVSFTLGAQYLTLVGSLPLTVRNSGYISNALMLPVVNPVPTLTSISPTTVTAGSPNFPLIVAGSGLSTASTVLINGISHAVSSTDGMTATVSVNATEVAAVGRLNVTIVNPSPGGGTSESRQLQVIGAGNRLRTLNYPTLDIVSDNVHQLIYASVSSTSATSPNCVLAIDPLQGTVVGTQTMPSQPGQLAVTDDGSYLYVSLPAAGQISRLTLPSLTPDINWSLGSDGSGHAYSAEDMESAPGQPHTVAVTRWLSGFGTGATGGLTIYDDGIARKLIPMPSYPAPSFDTVAWGNDATTLFGTMAVTSGGPEYIFTVNQDGPTLSTTIPSVLGDFVSRLTFESKTGRLYDGYGNAVDALTGAAVGKFNVQNTISYIQNPFAIDSAQGKAFFLNANSFYQGSNGPGEDIQAFDLNRFSFINAIAPPGLSGSKIVQWGGSGLAVGGGSPIFLIDGSFVSTTGISSPIGGYVTPSPTLTSVSPQTIAAGSGAVDITLNGTNFSQAAVVTWNGQTLPVNWLSDTQVTATIPASMLAQPLTAPVFISNGAGTENSPGVPFAVLPGLGPNMQITALNISGQDMVWDPVRSLLYVTGTNPSTVDGNSIAVVDPARPAIQNIVYTGNQPSALDISDDGHYLYAGFQTLSAVKRFALPDFSLDLTIPLNSGSVSSSFAGEVKVAPGHPETIAVSMGNKDIEPRDSGGLAIFDNAVQRPNALAFSIPDTFKLAWGKDSSKLYANTDPEFQYQGFSVLAIDSTGVSRTEGFQSLQDIGLRPHYDSGTNLVYSDWGRVANPADGTSAGVLESRGLMVPDAKLNRAFFLRTDGATGLFYLDIFDLQRLTFLKSITIPGIAGGPTQLVRWGDQGLAFLTDTDGDGLGMLYLLQGSDITGVSTPPAGSVTLSPANIVEGSATSATVTVNGADFLPTSTVLVNGSPRATTFLSSTQVSFQLSAADLAFAHYISIAVTNYATGGTTSPAATLEVDNPVPTITSLDKPNILIGSADTTITISGSGFVPTTIAQFNGTLRTTTYISPTQVSCVLTYPDLLTAGIFPLTVVNPAPGGGSSAAPIEVDNPAPVIFGLYPSIVMTGSTGQNVAVQGTGFVPGTVIQVGGTPRLATYTGSNSINVQFTTADFASPGNISVIAVNPAPGGGPSGAASIAVNNNVPGPITLNPSTVLQGTSTPTSITVSGSNFLPGSFVQVNNTNRPTTYVSQSQLTFLLTVADQATASSLHVTVVNPSPGGGSSTASLNVAAQAQTPIISSVYPSQFVTGTTNAYLQVIGTGFGASSVIEWDGTPLITSYDSYSGYFVAQVPASLLTTTGTVSITVNNATATPPLSNALTVTVVDPPAPSLTSISPAFGPINTAFTATLTGTDFVPNSTVAVNSVVVPTTFVNSTQLTAFVPASAIIPGNISFTVTTPQPGGGTSGTIIYTAYVPIVNNSMVYNPADQLFYLSVPGNSGTPYANSVVSLDPVTGALGTPIFVGSEPNRLALASDGKSLWVGLDGASAIRKVDLVTHTAGQQFSLPTSSSYGSPMKALAMVAVPGQTDSVIISSAAGNQYGTTIGMLTLYDSGIPRGSSLSASPLSLQIDGSRNEVYGASGSLYQTYLYGSSGLASGTSVNTGSTLAAYEDDRIQLASGRIYTDYGKTFDVESGALVGTFAVNTTYNSVPTALDPTAGLAFMLNTPIQFAALPSSIQLFNLADFTSASAAAIPVNIATNSFGPVAALSDLTRWGANGLAFRNNVSIYPLRSNLVKDLSDTPVDLGVTLTSSGPNNTGTQTTYTATISNAGPASASEISLTALVPSTGVLVSASPSSGFCSSGANVTCNLGALASGSSATVNLTVSQLTSGVSTMTVQVNASQTDANLANNQAASTSTITGQTYTVAPTLLSMTPTTVLAGSSDTTITVAGAGFGPGSAILLDGTPLPTNVVSATQLSAILPAASVAALGWHLVTVSNPSPGGGVSAALTLSIYSAIKAGANHIIYDPFSRKVFASVGSAMSSGNSIASLTPETGTFSTPAPIGSEPTRMALSDDGQMLYVLVSGASQIVRYNMLTQQPEAAFPLNPSIASDNATAAAFAVQPGSEDTLAVTQGVGQPIEIVDFDSVNHTASARSSVVNVEAYSPRFLDSSTLFTTGSNFTSSLARYSILPSGLSSSVTYSLVSPPMGPFSLVNGIAFTSYGGVADVTTQSSRQLGQFPFSIPSTYNIDTTIGPQVSFDRAFFLAGYDGTNYTVTLPSGIAVFDTNTFSPAAFLPLNIPFIPEYNASAAADVIRWGQDGLAALTTDGTIYLLRGPAILHQLLQTNTPPVVSGSSGTLQHGSGNGILSLFGTNFLPGVAVTWNGTYRTTNWLDANHITVDIPATDLNLAGSASIAAANPGSASSSAFIVAIN